MIYWNECFRMRVYTTEAERGKERKMEREELLKEIIELIITSTDDEIQEAFERLKIQRDLTSLVSMVE